VAAPLCWQEPRFFFLLTRGLQEEKKARSRCIVVAAAAFPPSVDGASFALDKEQAEESTNKKEGTPCSSVCAPALRRRVFHVERRQQLALPAAAAAAALS
jgi:hypothetical protein